MPPRPPLTSLVIHTWKEHGKPRPLSNEEKSETSARARISRSISIDAALLQQKAAYQSDDDVFPPSLPHKRHLRGHISRSSTFDDSLSIPVQQTVAAAARTEVAAYEAMARSCVVDEGFDVHGGPVTKPLPCRIQSDDAFSSPLLLTPMESEDESEHGPPPMRASDVLPPHRGMEALPPRPRRTRRRTNSTSGMCVRAVSMLAKAPNEHVKIMHCTPGVVQTKIRTADSSPVRSRHGRIAAHRRRERSAGRPTSLLQESLLEQSASFDTGLSAIARGHESMQ